MSCYKLRLPTQVSLSGENFFFVPVRSAAKQAGVAVLSSGSILLRLNGDYEQRHILMRLAGESFVLPLEHFLRLPLSGCADMEVTPTQTVEDSHVWKGLPGDGVCNSAYEACSRVPLDDLVETGKIITPQHGRPMRATMSLCAGISHGNVPLLLKYAFRGVTKANWQSRPIPQGLFDVVAHVFFSTRRFLPETYRSIFPNCLKLMLSIRLASASAGARTERRARTSRLWTSHPCSQLDVVRTPGFGWLRTPRNMFLKCCKTHRLI